MKKIYGFLCLGLICSGLTLHAQLSGVYTIDDTAPVSATNFTSFTQFASTLNAQGVSGPVTVNVGILSGPYNEQVEFIQYPGSSATNSVVINGNGRTITFNATNVAARHTIMLSGADYMTWNNLQVIGTNGTSALVVHLWNGADNNTFNDMYIEAPLNGSSTTQVPFSISGSNVAATTAGNSGSNNIVNTCTIVGGYYNTVFYGNTGTPQNTGNEIHNSVVRDFYLYGFYNAYCGDTKVIGNLVDRLNRTTVSSTYGIYLTTGTTNGLVEGNYVRDVFINNVGSTSLAYLIYVVADAAPTAPNIIRNNVVSDILNNGTTIGIYLSGADYAYAEHNTISLDYALSTSGTAYGIYGSGPNEIVRNNNVSVTRGGSGTKYGLYYTTAATGLVSDYNNVYVATSGVYAYLSTPYNTLATWQSGTGYDMNSMEDDPQFANPATYDYKPTNLAINNKALLTGLQYDVLNASRSHLTPDVGAYEFFNTPCSGLPPSNSFVVPTGSICPGAQIGLALLNTITYTNSGYTVQWNSSTNSPFGPFQSISGATLNSHFTSPITSNTHYQAVITCTFSGQSFTTTTGSMFLMPNVQDTVPYFESFETPAQNNLPNCYWSVSSFGDETQTSTTPASGNRAARTDSGYAYFKNSPVPEYFYTNQILLKAGITYSAALWYITENIGFDPWPEMSILVGTSQSPNGLQPIVSASPVTGQLYNLLSNTFEVSTTGYYYVAVRATGGFGAAPYLTWDDLSITIPCSLNSPTVSVFAPVTPVCQGMPTTLAAGGAHTYSWSTGNQGPTTVVTPVTNSSYIVYGLDTLSGCSSSVTINLATKTAPAVGAAASQYSVCTGQSTTLTATGADTYFWSTGFSGQVIVVNPSISTAYVVAGTNSAGCTASTQVFVQVYSPPVMSAQASSTLICQGEAVQLSAQGANSYVWLAPNLYKTQSQFTVVPQSSTIYTITATTEQGCSKTSQISVVVDACAGLSKIGSDAFRVYPNPATDRLFVQTAGDASITITDVSGRVIASRNAASGLSTFDLTHLSAGVYYVSLKSNDHHQIEKFIKH